MKTQNISKIRAHDAICGILYLVSGGLYVYTSNDIFLYAAIGDGVLQLISPVTKFCPVYFVLNKIMPDYDPIQNGS